MGLDYLNKISGKLENEELFDLRNSSILRLQSVIFHYEILASIHISGTKREPAGFNYDIGHRIGLQQDFIFDSLIFNLTSFFDYLACLVFFVITKSQKKKTQWQSLANHARSKPGFSQSNLAAQIDKMDKKMVTKLTSYRSDLIPYRDDHSSQSQTYTYGQSSSVEIKVSAPSDFIKRFKKHWVQGQDFHINSITLWLIESAEVEVEALLRELRSYIDTIRVIPVGKEPIQFKPQDKKSP